MAKIEIFPFSIEHSCTTLRVKNSLYLLWFSRYSHFFIFRKKPRWLPKVAKIENFPFSIEHSCTTLRVNNSLYLLRFPRYSHFFIFRKNPRWPPKVGKIENFPLLHRTLLYYPAGQKFTLSLMVFEILTLFHFSLKSKMAAKSGEN